MHPGKKESRESLPNVFGSKILEPTEHFIRTSPFLHIHEDTLRSILHRHLANGTSLISWTTPAAAALTLLLSLLTANYRTVFSLPSEFWRASFTILLIITLVSAVVMFLRRRKRPTAEEIIDDIREGARVVSSIADGEQTIGLAADK
jgi:hypothetical protein